LAQEKLKLYSNLAAGAESGWDYSTRWIPGYNNSKNYTQEELLRELETSQVIPVDLNSIMYRNEILLANFFKMVGNKDQAKKLKLAAKDRAKLMHAYMWDSKRASFFDYFNHINKKSSKFASSNYWPFWSNALTKKFKARPKNYFRAFKGFEKIFKSYLSGQPATEQHSGLQWDYPNKWAPLEYVIVEGLLTSSKKVSDPCYRAYFFGLARKIAQSYITDTFCGWYKTGGHIPGLLNKLDQVPEASNGHMFEKYNVDRIGGAGGGGEYDVQTGFGWTNGVLLHFINRFSGLKTPSNPKLTCKV